jgi:hypothetical protein
MGLLFGGLSLLGIYGIRKEPAPKISELMSFTEYKEFSMQNLAEDIHAQALHPFVKYLENAQKNLDKIESENWLYQKGNLEDFVSSNYMDIRLGTSLLRAVELLKDKKLFNINGSPTIKGLYEQKGEKRMSQGLVPYDFLGAQLDQYILNYSHMELDDLADTKILQAALKFLKLQIPQDNDNDGKVNALDAFIGYFSNPTDISSAKARAFSMYNPPSPLEPMKRNFSFYGRNNGIGYMSGGGTKDGWGLYLPKHQQDLIYTSLGLYLITDDSGKINWNKLPTIKTDITMQFSNENVIMPEEK